jgi:hypothetical protein
MGVNVGNRFSEHATIVLGETGGGKAGLRYQEASDFNGAIGIGATNSVGAKSVENKPGSFITELRDTVGGTLGADDVSKIFQALTFSDGRGAPEGIDGVSLIGVTTDSFTVAIDNGRSNLEAPDTITFEVGGNWFAANGFDQGANASDADSKFSIISSGEGSLLGGDPISDLVGGQFGSGPNSSDTRNLLAAAIESSDDRVKLIGLEEDNFTVQIVNLDRWQGEDTVDTVLFTGEAAEQAIASLSSGVNLSNRNDEFAFVDLGDSGNVPGGTGGSLNFLAKAGEPRDVGGLLSPVELAMVASTAEDRPNVNVIDQGNTLRIEVDASRGTTDIYVLNEPDPYVDLLSGGEFGFA